MAGEVIFHFLPLWLAGEMVHQGDQHSLEAHAPWLAAHNPGASVQLFNRHPALWGALWRENHAALAIHYGGLHPLSF
jgi:hypothetical protein